MQPTPASSRFSPYAVSALRIITGLLYMQHGFQKLFKFPDAGHHPEPFDLVSLAGIAGVLETFGGFAIVIGLFTRSVSFVLAGQMAVAYFLIHLGSNLQNPRGFFPVVNGGDLAILFCFVFLFFFSFGPGRLSVDAALVKSNIDR